MDGWDWDTSFSFGICLFSDAFAVSFKEEKFCRVNHRLFLVVHSGDSAYPTKDLQKECCPDLLAPLVCYLMYCRIALPGRFQIGNWKIIRTFSEPKVRTVYFIKKHVFSPFLVGENTTQFFS